MSVLEWEVCRTAHKYVCHPLFRNSCGHTEIFDAGPVWTKTCPNCGETMIYEGGQMYPSGTILVWDERPET